MSTDQLPSGTTVDRDHLNLPFALGWAQQSIKGSLREGGLPAVGPPSRHREPVLRDRRGRW